MATPTQQRLQAYLDAETMILGGQSVRMGDRQLQLPDLEFVQKQIGLLQLQLQREQSPASTGRGRFSQADFS
jgi:hypothetical protein